MNASDVLRVIMRYGTVPVNLGGSVATEVSRWVKSLAGVLVVTGVMCATASPVAASTVATGGLAASGDAGQVPGVDGSETLDEQTIAAGLDRDVSDVAEDLRAQESFSVVNGFLETTYADSFSDSLWRFETAQPPLIRFEGKVPAAAREMISTLPFDVEVLEDALLSASERAKIQVIASEAFKASGGPDRWSGSVDPESLTFTVSYEGEADEGRLRESVLNKLGKELDDNDVSEVEVVFDSSGEGV